MSKRYRIIPYDSNNEACFKLEEFTPDEGKKFLLKNIQNEYAQSHSLDLSVVEYRTQILRDLIDATGIPQVGHFWGKLSYRKRTQDYILETLNKRYYSDEHRKVLFAWFDEFDNKGLFDIVKPDGSNGDFYVESKIGPEDANRIYHEFRKRMDTVISELSDDALRKATIGACDKFSVLDINWMDEWDDIYKDITNQFEQFVTSLNPHDRQRARIFADETWVAWIRNEAKSLDRVGEPNG